MMKRPADELRLSDFAGGLESTEGRRESVILSATGREDTFYDPLIRIQRTNTGLNSPQ